MKERENRDINKVDCKGEDEKTMKRLRGKKETMTMVKRTQEGLVPLPPLPNPVFKRPGYVEPGPISPF